MKDKDLYCTGCRFFHKDDTEKLSDGFCEDFEAIVYLTFNGKEFVYGKLFECMKREEGLNFF